MVRKFSSDKEKSSILIEVEDKKILYDIIKSGCIEIGWKKHKIKKFNNNKPIRCFNCRKFGHFARLCINKVICPRCTQNHSLKNFSSIALKCANCNENREAKVKYVKPV